MLSTSDRAIEIRPLPDRSEISSSENATKLPVTALSFMSTTSIFWPDRNRLKLLQASKPDCPEIAAGAITISNHGA
jgi:hypothetical protein